MKKQTGGYAQWVFLTLPVLWMGAVLAYAYEDGMNLFELLGSFSAAMEYPFAIGWTPHTLKFIAGALAAYGFAVALYLSSRQNRRPGEEHGSAHWGNVHQLDRKYRDKNQHNNAILSQNLHMSLNGRQHLRNLLQIVVGGSGSGKTRYVVKPNIYEANASYIATDPKGELARAAVPLLLREGYVIR